MKIEPATTSWAELFWVALDSVARERRYLLFLEGPEKSSTAAFVRKIVENNWTQFYAIVNDEVVGWCDIIPQEREGVRHVGHLGMGVVKEHRGKGFGESLLKTSISDAFSKGIERIELEVFASNTAAIALYEKFGFKHEGKKRKARFVDGVYDDILVMGFLKADSEQGCS